MLKPPPSSSKGLPTRLSDDEIEAILDPEIMAGADQKRASVKIDGNSNVARAIELLEAAGYRGRQDGRTGILEVSWG